MVFPLLAGSLLAGGGWLAGKSASGGMELLTSKKEEMTINAPFAPFVYSPTTDVTISSISGSEGASISSKKETSGSTTPMSQNLSPVQAQGSGGGAGGTDYMTIAVIGGLGVGAYYFLKKK